ncbi:protein mono-ADP-ribosyltransferase TIPARP-like [Euwallacea fornicatus]|uniref:protein mono-ADP-ribosyltransferase TIPARP-like n=1 Tax=Euwallacea fornicatus TaxID=995702 RepID=UPI00338D3E4E
MNYQDILNLTPPNWTEMKPHLSFSRVCLDPYSTEFINVRAKLNGNYIREIRGIYRVQNPLLWTKFLHKKFEYENRGYTDMKTLFHDTSVDSVDSICAMNFDWRYGHRFKFGPGVYFSTQPNTAFKRSSKFNNPIRAMFMVDVLIQNVIQAHGNDVFFPTFGFDTVWAQGGQTCIKYFDSEYYPRYFMVYEAKLKYCGQYSLFN